MELRHNDKVEFIEFTHSYLMGDKELIGVTSLMKKHGLGADYTGISPEILSAKAVRGTACHKLLEDYDNGLQVEETAYLPGYKALALNVLASEYLVSDNETVASMIDKVIAVSDTEVDLADIKTTSSLHKDAVSWQLSIYAYLFELQNPGVKVRNLYAVHVRLNTGKVALIKIRRRPDKDVTGLIEAERNATEFAAERQTCTDMVKYNTADLVKMELKYAELKAAMSQLEEVMKVRTAELLSLLDRDGVSEVETEVGKFTVRAAYDREGIDSKKLKEKYPDVARDCQKTTHVAATLTFTMNK